LNLVQKLAADKVEKGVADIITFFADMAPTLRGGFLTQIPEIAGTSNVYGEEQMKLDVWADKTILEKLVASKRVCAIFTEEQPEIVKVAGGANYAVCIDPMDGSSNIKTNLAMGTIVAIFGGSDALAPGKEQKAALYLLFGPVTTLVVTWGKGVNEFIFDGKQFLMRAEGIKLPEKPVVYVPGGRKEKWLPGFAKFMAEIEKTDMKSRNNGCMVSDVNTLLKYGGIFTYPSQTDKPEGKLRVLCEANPMSFIIEQAGGYGSDGKKSLLEIKPTHSDQRTPIYLGNKELVKKVESYLKA